MTRHLPQQARERCSYRGLTLGRFHSWVVQVLFSWGDAAIVNQAFVFPALALVVVGGGVRIPERSRGSHWDGPGLGMDQDAFVGLPFLV